MLELFLGSSPSVLCSLEACCHSEVASFGTRDQNQTCSHRPYLATLAILGDVAQKCWANGCTVICQESVFTFNFSCTFKKKSRTKVLVNNLVFRGLGEVIFKLWTEAG